MRARRREAACRRRREAARDPQGEAARRGISGMLCSARELGLSEDHAGPAWCSKPTRRWGATCARCWRWTTSTSRSSSRPTAAIACRCSASRATWRALTGARVRLPAAPPVPSHPTAAAARCASPSRGLAPTTSAASMRGIDPAARTPQWMVRRLERAGLRAISPLVDITNYVMLERGQPMHAFDDAKLAGGIDVRWMKPGEKIEAAERAIGRLPREAARHHRRHGPGRARGRDGRRRPWWAMQPPTCSSRPRASCPKRCRARRASWD